MSGITRSRLPSSAKASGNIMPALASSKRLRLEKHGVRSLTRYGISLWSLTILSWPFWSALAGGSELVVDTVIVGVAGTLLLVLSVWLIAEAARVLLRGRTVRAPVGAAGKSSA